MITDLLCHKELNAPGREKLGQILFGNTGAVAGLSRSNSFEKAGRTDHGSTSTSQPQSRRQSLAPMDEKEVLLPFFVVLPTKTASI